jgi:cyclic-di-GMP phosphodiesterase TipF (flagellum assembly factor)
MQGYGFVFIAVCMALIAASLGAVLHLAIGLTIIEAGLIALALLFALLTLEVASARARDRRDSADRFDGLARVATDIAREVGDLRHRIAAVESLIGADRQVGAGDLSREIGALGRLVEDLAQAIARHETLLAPRPPRGEAAANSTADVAKPRRAPLPAAPAPAAPLAAETRNDLEALLREAIEAGRIDLYLQPVVALPQRKVRYYEALSRMRLPDGTVVEAREFIEVARAAGLLPRIDERLVRNCVQVVRRLAAKNREIGLFLNIAPETLSDRAVFSEILAHLEANRALAPALVLELPQAAFRSLAAVELESLALLAERGFRFSLDRIEDFRIDPRGLADRGVRFVKVPAELMLKRVERSGHHVHPADLADLLARYGIDLVADRIENETIVVDLLDYDVRYGQGFLFSPPRPVRADILHSDRAGEPAITAADGNGASAEPAPASVAPPAREFGETARRA